MGPDGWSEVRLGDVFAEVADRNNRERLPVLAVTLDRGVVRRESLDRKMDREVEQDAYLRALPGDIAYNTMRMWQGGSGLVREPGFVSPAYTVLRARGEECPEFWAHAFKAPGLIDSFRAFSQGVAKDRHRLYYDQFSAVRTLRPPLAEQRKIAAILSSVDETVEKTEAVIAQLDIVKKAMLEELLTRGIPGRHSRFKQTEIGEVPEEWRVVRVDEVCGSFSGGTPARSRPDYYGGPIPWVKSGEVGGNRVRRTEETLTVDGMESSPARWVPSGSTLVAMYGATAGQVGLLEIEATTNQAVLALVPRAEVIGSAFLYYSMQNGAATLLGRTQGSGQPNLNSGLVRGLAIALPSLEEQTRIADVLASIESRLSAEQAALAAVRATKNALASELLTGALRVAGGSAA